jgi:hypothetical protein
MYLDKVEKAETESKKRQSFFIFLPAILGRPSHVYMHQVHWIVGPGDMQMRGSWAQWAMANELT